MRILVIIFTIILFANAAQARQITRSGGGTSSCPVKAPGWANKSEKWAWYEICKGNVAHMEQAPGGNPDISCDALDTDIEWPKARQIRARFIKLITTQGPYILAPATPAVRFECTEVVGQLDLENEIIPQELWIDHSRIADGVILVGARFERRVTFDYSLVFPGEIDASYIFVTGDFSIREGKTAKINLGSAKVGAVRLYRTVIGGEVKLGSLNAEYVNLNSANVLGKLSAFNVTLGGNLLMSNGSFGEVEIYDAKIGHNLSISKSTFHGPFSAYRTKVGAGVNAKETAFKGNVYFWSSTIATILDFQKTRILGKFNGRGIYIGDNGYFNHASVCSVGLQQAKIAGNLIFRNPHIQGELNLAGARIGQNLKIWTDDDKIRYWFDSVQRAPRIWHGPNASLNLRNAQVGALHSNVPKSWIKTLGSAPTECEGGHTYSIGATGIITDETGVVYDEIPENKITGETYLPVDFTGFTYQALGGALATPDTDLSNNDVSTLIDWIEGPKPKGRSHHANYTPQPYSQLASFLTSIGANQKATRVKLSRNLHRIRSRDYLTLRAIPALLWDIVWGLTTGFGLYPVFSLFWFLTLVGFGVYYARKSPCLCDKGWLGCFWYSLENALPLIEASEDHKVMQHKPVSVQNFFHFQKIAGFLLATVLVGALTLGSG